MSYKIYAKWKDEVALVTDSTAKELADHIANVERAKKPNLSFFVVHHEWFPTMTFDKMNHEVDNEALENNSQV